MDIRARARPQRVKKYAGRWRKLHQTGIRCDNMSRPAGPRLRAFPGLWAIRRASAAQARILLYTSRGTHPVALPLVNESRQ